MCTTWIWRPPPQSRARQGLDHLEADVGLGSDLGRVGRGALLVVVRIGDVAGSAMLVAP